MARGTVVGETPVTQAQSKAWDKGCEQAGIGAPKGERGRFVWDESQGKLVPAAEYHAARAVDAPIMMDRYYENTAATDGTDIGSRRKHRAYMREHGLTTADDFKGQWEKAGARREAMKRGELHDRSRRDVIERKFHEIQNKR
jgi:hypothetical protein